MKNSALIILFTCLVRFTSFAQSQIPLSSEAKISVIEVGRDNIQLFQVFGHIAISVKDYATGFNKVYSYGGFDFNTENFYWKFITGQLPYRMTESNMQEMLLEYGPQYENRSVTEYELDLSPDQVQKIYQYLENNIQPPNNTYQYKFFYDNCSTRIRDVLNNTLGKSLLWGPLSNNNNKSYRSHMNDQLHDRPFSALGMNLAIGLPADKVCTDQEAMYLPKNLAEALQGSTLNAKKLVNRVTVLYSAQNKNSYSSWTIWGYLWPILLFLLPIISLNILNKTNSLPKFVNSIGLGFYRLSVLLFVVLIVFLWFFTSHGVTTYNLQILWLIPVAILWVPSFLKNKIALNYYRLVCTIYWIIVVAFAIYYQSWLALGWNLFMYMLFINLFYLAVPALIPSSIKK
jgi:hypothetical protein